MKKNNFFIPRMLMMMTFLASTSIWLPFSFAFANSVQGKIVDIGPKVKQINSSDFSKTDTLRVKRNTFADNWAKTNGYYLCGVLADLNFYTKDRSLKIEEDFTRILCDDESYLNWSSYSFQVQKPLKIEEVDGNIVLTSFMLEPCANVSVTKDGKAVFSKKTIQPLTRTVLCKADDAAKPENFSLTSDDALYKKLTSLGNVIDWTVSFNGDTFRKVETATNPIYPMRPVYCREWIATISNNAGVIASKEYEDLCYEGVENKWFVKDQWQTEFLSKKEMGYLLQKTRKHTFRLGNCDGGGLAELNGEGLWLLPAWFRHLGKNEPHGFFHEFSHNMGWNHHDGNMCNQGAENGYGEKCWPMMGCLIFRQLYNEGKLPYNDQSLLNSDLFSYDELHIKNPPEDIIKDGVLYITSGLEGVGVSQYENDTRFSKVEFPPSVVAILSDAFRQSYLSELNLPATVKRIGSGAFLRTMLTSTVVIPDGVEEIGQGAFMCTRIPKIVVPASVKKFGPDITDRQVVWVVTPGTAAYEYAVKSNYQIEVPAETPETAFARILKEKAVAGPKYSWTNGDFSANSVRTYWDFSEFLDGEGRYIIDFSNKSGYNKLWLSDALFVADGKLLEYFPKMYTTRSIDYAVYVPAGTKKLEMYALAHTNGGTNSTGTIEVERR